MLVASPVDSKVNPCDEKNIAIVLSEARDLAQSKDFSEALACLAEAEKIYPKNRDISFQRIRIQAWQGNIVKAQADLAQWQPLDREGLELEGDLYWFADDAAAAKKSYLAAIDFESKIPPSSELKLKFEKAKSALRTRSAGANTESRAPDLMVLERQYYQQSDTLLTTETKGSVSVERANILGRVEALSLVRELADSTTQDAILEGTVGRRWKPRQLTELSFGKSLGEPKAAYRQMVNARHEGFVTARFYLGGEVRSTRYDVDTVTLGAISAGFYSGNTHGFVKFFQSQKGYSSLIRGQYKLDNFSPELWGMAGQGEALRPYLLESRDRPVAFRAVGVKLAWKRERRPGLGLFLDAEWRTEETAFQRMLGGGVTWAF